MSSASRGVTQNLTGVVGIIEKSITMRPDVIFLISDASFQWRPTGGFTNIPYDDIKEAGESIEEELRADVPIHFLAFEPKDNDAKEWSRIVRKTGGEFRELKEN